MVIIVSLNDKGLTLIEILIANFILIVVFFAIMETAMLALNTSTVNNLREMGTNIAEQEINNIKSKAFDNISGTLIKTVTRSNRGGIFNFTVKQNIIKLDNVTKKIIVNVDWQWKGKKYNHSIAGLIRK